MRRIFVGFCILALLGAGRFWLMTAPKTASQSDLAGLTGDATLGKQIFIAGGCASCHAAKEAEGDARLILSGGQRFSSDFGTFLAPNISNHPTAGIGDWSDLDLLNALRYGTSPQGTHYYPAFPYTTYQRMRTQDVVDLRAYLASLPADASESLPHEVAFPFNIRLALGGWKLLFLQDAWTLTTEDPQLKRGRYLVEALAHCSECHTPRNILGGPILDKWLSGAPVPVGKGSFPNITPAKLDWSAADIAEYLVSGFTPEFDTAGGQMVEVIDNMAQLSSEDRAAIAAYLKAVPGVP